MENTPNNNPLNTGNGVNPANTAAPAIPTTTPTPAQAPSITPTTPPPSMPVNITPGVVKPAPTSNEAVATNIMDKAAKIKKYIIAGVAGLALLTAIYVGYSFFTASSDLVDTATELSDLNNKLSTPSTETTDSKTEETPADKEKLNEVVNELKDQYKTPEASTSNPPGISIQLDAPKTDSSAPSTENPSQPDSTTDTDTSSNTSVETSDSTSVPR